VTAEGPARRLVALVLALAACGLGVWATGGRRAGGPRPPSSPLAARTQDNARAARAVTAL
jgi:hypothetical protein